MSSRNSPIQQFTSNDVDAVLDRAFDMASDSSSQFGGSIDEMLDEACEMLLEEEMESDADDERPWGGSHPGKARNKDRDFIAGWDRLQKDYFSGPDSTCDENDFERRFRMSNQVFNRIVNVIIGHESFRWRKDAAGKQGIHPMNRLVAVLHVFK